MQLATQTRTNRVTLNLFLAGELPRLTTQVAQRLIIWLSRRLAVREGELLTKEGAGLLASRLETRSVPMAELALLIGSNVERVQQIIKRKRAPSRQEAHELRAWLADAKRRPAGLQQSKPSPESRPPSQSQPRLDLRPEMFTEHKAEPAAQPAQALPASPPLAAKPKKRETIAEKDPELLSWPRLSPIVCRSFAEGESLEYRDGTSAVRGVVVSNTGTKLKIRLLPNRNVRVVDISVSLMRCAARG